MHTHTQIYSAAPVKKLKTFDGVFVPVFLSIWGIILFIRLGFIIGEAGLLGTLVMFIMSYVVAVTSSLSQAAIATNGIVRGGGAYYMISRCLGPEFGGSIGVVLVLGNVFSATMNAIGFVEPFLQNFGIENGSVVPFFPEGQVRHTCFFQSAHVTH